MSGIEIETVSRNPIIQTSLQNGDEHLKTSVEPASDRSSSTTDAKTEDTPATSPDTVHLTGDLKLSLDAKAPPVQNPYNMAKSMSDLPCAAYALELFLASHMLESEDYMHKGDPKKFAPIVSLLFN